MYQQVSAVLSLLLGQVWVNTTLYVEPGRSDPSDCVWRGLSGVRCRVEAVLLTS